jgi:predicted ribosomally synthesized peptide with nif11-like leader
MAKEKAVEFLKMLEGDEKLHSRIQEKTPAEVAETARGLSFDFTEEELNAAVAEMKAERARQKEPVSLPAESLDRVVGGMFGEGETAPDGHELGCLLSWHGNDWQEEHKVYCHKESLCDHHFYVCLVTSNKSHNLYMDS